MRVAKVAGVEFVVDDFFLVLLCVYTLIGFLPEAVALWGIVLVHEGAHAIAAYRLGMKLQAIEIMPFGGVARFEDLLEADPRREVQVSIAGPLSNFLLAAVSWILAREGFVAEQLSSFLVQSNLLLGAFNLMPALPLDGGRIYRAYLAAECGLVEATRRAARLSAGLALTLILIGVPGALYGYINPLSLGVGAFLFWGALKERSSSAYAFMRYLTRKREEIGAKGVLRARILVALGEATIGTILREFAPRFYHLVIVVDSSGTALGLISEDVLIQKMLEEGMGVTMFSLLDKQ